MRAARGGRADATGTDATAKPGKIGRAVRTLADIERERARERDVPAPIDRGDGPAPAPGTVLAQEGGTFTASTETVVKYGVDTRWIIKTVTGTVSCTNAYFGSDPAPCTVKSCVAA
jgi:hypothetical protein